MTAFDRLRDGFFDECPRRSELTELPLCVGEVGLATAPVSWLNRNLTSRAR
jgi:hypothetical protein